MFPSSAVPSAAYHIQTVVVGAGVIGLACARALAKAGKEVLIVDKAPMIGSFTSSRNSEVIHAGIYYPKSSLKAKFCVQGKKLLYEYCKSRNITHKPCGKLIVATSDKQMNEDMQELKQKAVDNGVLDVELFSKEQVKDIEPQVECCGALWSPSTGVVDSHSLMISLLADAENNGATLALHSGVDGGRIYNTTTNSNKIFLNMDDTTISCDSVVNSAGLWADEIARKIHSPSSSTTAAAAATSMPTSLSWRPPQQYFAKGNYFRLEGVKSPFQHLVYPMPEAAGGLGVHATIDWAGEGIKFGPDVEWLHPDTVPENIDYTPSTERLESFYDAIRLYWPSLPDNSLVPDFAGVRPKLHHPSLTSAKANDKSKLLHSDYIIAGSDHHGCPGLVHMFGMESPGLTSSLAIAEYVKDLILRDDK